jgi:hypothetical protein
MACQAAHLAQHIASVTRVPRTHRRSALAAGLNAALTGALARSVVTAARKGGAGAHMQHRWIFHSKPVVALDSVMCAAWWHFQQTTWVGRHLSTVMS